MPLRPEIVRRAHIVLLSVLSLAKGAIWIALIPPLLVADEPAHFDHVQYRAEHHQAPVPDGSGKPVAKVMGDGSAPELRRLWSATLGKTYYREPHVGSRLPALLESNALSDLDRDTTGQMTAMSYPFLYYQLGVPFYRAFQTHSVVTRILSVRVLSMLFGLLAVLATYLAARRVTDDASLALAAAMVVALQPMLSQMTAAVNNDAGMIGLGALLFYFEIRALSELPAWPSARTLAGLALSTVLLVYTKPTGYGALPGLAVVGFALAATHWLDRRVRLAALGCLLVGIFGLGYVMLGGHSPMPGDTAQPGPHGHPDFWSFLQAIDPTYHDYLVRSTWGQFGWLDYSLQGNWLPLLRTVFSLVEVGTVVAAATFSLRALDRPFWFRGPLWLFSIGMTLVGVIFILYVEHRFRLIGAVGVIQGRNFLFALPAFAIWTAIALGALVPSRMRGLIAACIVSGALLLNVGGMLAILRQHYAP